MELVYLLLLLLCGKVDFASTNGGADLQHSEGFRQTTAGPESENVPEHSSDLQAQLRDIRTELTELRAYRQTIDQLQVQVEQLRTQNQDQAAELKSLKTWTNVTERNVDSLMRDKAVGRVAFSVSLRGPSSIYSGYSGPYDKHTTLVYRHVISNIGDAYDKASGIFTAPVGGAYHFEFFFKVVPNSAGCLASLMKNNQQRIITAHEEQPNGYGTAGNAATVLLSAGDTVSVQIFQSYGMFDSHDHHSTFSGHLLYVM